MRSDFIPRTIAEMVLPSCSSEVNKQSSTRSVLMVNNFPPKIGLKKICTVCEMENRMRAVNCAFCTSLMTVFCVCGEDIEYNMPFCDVCSEPNPHCKITGQKRSASTSSSSINEEFI